MKRNMDLAREILLQLDDAPADSGHVNVTLEWRTENEVAYHVMLLHEAGLIDAIDTGSAQRVMWYPVRLTWDGHEFVELSRDENRWRQATAIMEDRAGGMAFCVLNELLLKLTAGPVLGA